MDLGPRQRKIYKFMLLVLSCMLITVSLAGSPIIAIATNGWQEGVLWLLGQQVPNGIVLNPVQGRSGLVISYIIPPSDPNYSFLFNRSWIYDDALAVIAWSMEGECQAAKDTLIALNGLVDAEGKLGFSYNTADHWFDSGRIRTGAIAWVGYSFIFYQRMCADSQFYPSAKRIVDWVLTMQDPTTGSVKGGPDANFFSTEHNIDAYMLVRDFALLSGNSSYLSVAEKIKQSLLDNHWNSSYGCFQEGLNNSNKVLDVASWGALFLLRIGEPDMAKSCLNFIEANFATSVICTIGGVSLNIRGYKPNVQSSTLWAEGSLGVAMAYLRASNKTKHDEIISEIWKLQGANGGITYACPPDPDKEFSDWESVAGTAWMVMVRSRQQLAFWNLPLLEISKRANPSSVQNGASLTYTIQITNTGSMTLTTSVTDILPKQTTPTGFLNWTPVIPRGSNWTKIVVVNVSSEYTGTLVNRVEVTTLLEGAARRASITVCVVVCKSYLPIITK